MVPRRNPPTWTLISLPHEWGARLALAQVPWGSERKATVSDRLLGDEPPRITMSNAATAAAAAAPAVARPKRARLRRRRSERRSAAIRRAIRSPSSAGGSGAGSSRAGSARLSMGTTGARASASARHAGQPSRWASTANRSSSVSWPRTRAPIRSRHWRHCSGFIAHLLERIAKRLEPVVDAAFDRAFGHAELRGDLCVGAPAKVGLHQDAAMLLADPAQRFLDLPVEQYVFERLVTLLGQLGADDRSGRAGAAQIDHDVAKDREQPGAERAELGIEAISGAPGA